MRNFLNKSSTFSCIILVMSLLACSCVSGSFKETSRVHHGCRPLLLKQAIRELGKDHPPTAIHAYNAELVKLLTDLFRLKSPAQLKGEVWLRGERIRIDTGSNELRQLDPSTFDEISILQHDRGSNQVQNQVRRDGVGIPLVMRQKFDPRKATGKKLFPLNGRHLPATAVIDLDSQGCLVLRLIHTRNVEVAMVGGATQVLAYDLSTPLHRSMGGGILHEIALDGLMNSDRYLDDTGIYLPDVYDPAKIPVVFVHGLKSDPRIWQNTMNEVLHDPQLRKKYQCWYFLYPTGLPVYASAEKLRRMLHVARDHYDPDHKNQAMNQMILVGHSMGGLLSRMQTIDSKDDIYQSFFRRPLQQLNLQPQTKKLIQEAMFFERVSFVKRVVFVASPHQGSSVAQIPVIRALGMLVNPTETLNSITMDIRLHANRDLQPALYKFRNMGCRSVQTLSPEHPILQSLQKCPIQVPTHSIIARKQPNGDVAETTDGVVAYWSSHLAAAKSEHVVHGSHGCTRLPEVSAEILRILRLHLK